MLQRIKLFTYNNYNKKAFAKGKIDKDFITTNGAIKGGNAKV